MDGICDIKGCKKPAEIMLTQADGWLCEKHWDDFMDQKKMRTKKGKEFTLLVNRAGPAFERAGLRRFV